MIRSLPDRYIQEGEAQSQRGLGGSGGSGCWERLLGLGDICVGPSLEDGRQTHLGLTALDAQVQRVDSGHGVGEGEGSQLRSHGLLLTSHARFRSCTPIRTQNWSQMENKVFDYQAP